MKSEKSVCISYPLGCPRSKVDAALLIEYFKLNGWLLTTDFKEADIVVIGSCAVTQKIEENSFGFLSIVKKKRKKGAKVFAFGCIAGISEKRLIEEYDITPLIRSSLKDLDAVIAAETGIESIDPPCDLAMYEDYLSKSFSSAERFFVVSKVKSPVRFVQNIAAAAQSPAAIKKCTKFVRMFVSKTNAEDVAQNQHGEKLYSIRVASGCFEKCSYCALRFSHEGLTSIPQEKVLQYLDDGLAKNFTVIRLLGEDIGGYGQDLGYTIVDLLREVFKREGNYKILFDDFHPKWLIKYYPDLNNLLTENAHHIDYIGFPLQSGSDKILDSMNREYKIADFIKCIQDLREKAPGLDIRTHVILGFPGETENDFAETLNLLKLIKFTKVTIYHYSDRPGAPSAEFPGKIPGRIIKQRASQIQALIAAH